MTIDFLSRKRMVLSELKLCMFGIVAFVECCNVIIFSHRCHVPYFNLAHQMNWFLFLLLLCKFLFDGPKLLEVMVVLLPGENSKCQFLRQYEHP